jgi:hypothetical protein
MSPRLGVSQVPRALPVGLHVMLYALSDFLMEEGL